WLCLHDGEVTDWSEGVKHFLFLKGRPSRNPDLSGREGPHRSEKVARSRRNAQKLLVEQA
ncbi:MAG: hypothetical protein OXM02_10370, partial [Bacteroidota bacterium]|nr:hypothetical protein [Bacteroidota bacterium]MDE2956950.1 hypothetical protein [Bacteroidota bacterium]